MNIKQKKGLIYEIGMASFKLILAGIIIGVFRKHDFWIAVLLILFILAKLLPKIIRNINQNLVLIIGMSITGVFGILAEYWGVTNGFWSYHELPYEREFPYWLFFSWMLAFYFMYKLECRLLPYIKFKSFKSKIILTVLISMIFPVFGEIITINLGVWTYYLPIQFFGVPLLAIVGLIILHAGVNSVLVFICYKFNIKDPLFSIEHR